MWQEIHQSYLGAERNTLVNPNWFQPCQCCCCLCYPGEYLKLGTLISYNWAQVLEACDCLFSEVQDGKRDRGAPRKRYKHELKKGAARVELAISHGSRRLQTETAGTHQWENPVVRSRQSGIKPQRKNAGGRKSEQHLNHPQPKPSSVQSAVGCAHQESDTIATNERAKTHHQPSQQSSSASLCSALM